MKKCDKCIWLIAINNQHTLCPFIRCVKDNKRNVNKLEGEETRKTAQGTEYWDNEKKKMLFVPVGQEPHFEVTENPKSMILGVDLATGKDNTTVEGKLSSVTVFVGN